MVNCMNFKEELQNRVTEIETIIQSYIPEETGYAKTVMEAMNYSILAGGKRLRPMLMQETYRMFGGKGKEVEPFMAALEMIHTYSLVHDDLPAMDNDEYRRGRKTTHVVYGEGMAILAGDGLLNYAFETAVKAFDMLNEAEADEYRRVAGALAILGRKAGIYGMIGGQTADIEAEQMERVTAEQLMYIHKNKTAALIEAAMTIGALLAGADDEQIGRIETCAYNIGIAFQVQDDILDVIGTEEELGKPIGSDEKNHKQTYVTLNGLEQSGEDVDRLSREAIQILNDCGERDHAFLNELVLQLVHRKH